MVSTKLADKCLDRSSTQWVYGEISSADELLGLLHWAIGEPQHEELLLDFGSGNGKLVCRAAELGMRSIGIELVPALHSNAVRALGGLSADAQRLVELLCEDGLNEVAPFAQATMVVCNNAVWDDELNSRVVAHVGAHALRLDALATTKKLPLTAALAAGMALTHSSALGVSWNPSGHPLFIYKRCSSSNGSTRVLVDPCFYDSCVMSLAERNYRTELATSVVEEQAATVAYGIIRVAAEAQEATSDYVSARRFTNAACDTLLGLLMSISERGHDTESCGHAAPSESEDMLLLHWDCGDARLLIFAAAFGMKCVGVECVEEQHGCAAAGLAQLPSIVRARIELFFGGVPQHSPHDDRLTAVMEQATLLVCSASSWDQDLLVRLPAARQLRAVIATTKLPDEVAEAAGLTLTRQTAVRGFWEWAVWLLIVYVYEPVGHARAGTPSCVKTEAFNMACGAYGTYW